MANTTNKAAKPAAKKHAAGKGTRYSDSEKQAVIAYVEEVNSAKGRGGVAAAAREFGITPLTIGNWLRQSGPAAGRSAGGNSNTGGVGRDRVLSDLLTLNQEIAKRRAELEALETRFDKLKASL